ncbi:actin-like ATPase domain-containing protein [Sistotremastrum niveocremeum HHB9708]|uniref:Xylulose kinase n=1 Tax=Sistotremastrum niveocremeum HHB9708 TaxID=1314777 RepID=A0A164W0S4_9AGAM|nr:actin-like ATPase domain-containing protein [Sistotremastrum niveocremeum HHB9708]
MSSPLFLGFDLSTQQLKAIVISSDTHIVHESSVHFDNHLPHHGTDNGAIHGEDGEAAAPVAMWIEAIDVLLAQMKSAGVDFTRIHAVSGSAQQHGSVYWSSDAPELLKNIPSDKTLEEHLCPGAFSLQDAPIWQDSSTTEECRALEAEVGGPQNLADLTGSRAYERFTGPQISKIYHKDREIYDATHRISLVSSFLASLFLQTYAPVEVSDASGMNLMNILTSKWDDHLLNACGGPSLKEKLGPDPVLGGTNLGSIGGWWMRKWGFPTDCIIAPFTGDNPGTVVALSTPGDALLSLGTSTTYLLAAPPSATPPKRMTTSHLLSHPTTEGASIIMLCYKNGALARSQIMERYAAGSWDKFNELVEQTPPGNNSRLGLYFPLIEIIPPNVQGQYLFSTTNHSVEPVESFPDEAHPRAILESQFLSIKSRVLEILPHDAPPLERLILTGGAAGNPTIRQLVADIFNLKVYVARTKEAGSLGGALLAKYVWWKPQQTEGKNSYTDMRHQDGDSVSEVATPNSHVAAQYEELVEAYRKAEEWVVARSTKNTL